MKFIDLYDDDIKDLLPYEICKKVDYFLKRDTEFRYRWEDVIINRVLCGRDEWVWAYTVEDLADIIYQMGRVQEGNKKYVAEIERSLEKSRCLHKQFYSLFVRSESLRRNYSRLYRRKNKKYNEYLSDNPPKQND